MLSQEPLKEKAIRATQALRPSRTTPLGPEGARSTCASPLGLGRTCHALCFVPGDPTRPAGYCQDAGTLVFVALLSLALGIAANTSIFSLVHSFLLRPSPYTQADQLVVVWDSQRSRFEDRQATTPGNYFDWREQASSFDALIAAHFNSLQR